MASKQLEGILGKVTTTTPSKSAASAPAAVNSMPATAEIVRMPAAVEQQVEKPAHKPAAKKKIEAQKSVQAFVPASIDKALRMKAAEEGTTTRNIILRGLKAIGFDVPEDELRDKRGKA